MTRSNAKWLRIFINGYDMSGFVNSSGPFGFKTGAVLTAALTDPVKNSTLGQMEVACGSINAFLAPSAATGFHELLKSGDVICNLLLAMGKLAEPTVGDAAFAYQFPRTEYSANGKDTVGVTVSFPGGAAGGPNLYPPFGYILHGNSAETAANTAVGTIDNGADSLNGGVFAYQLLSSNGSVTLSVDDSETNLNTASFAALSGATSGSIDASVTPKSGFISLATTATVRRYLRWQLAKGTATTATFICALIRG